VTTFTIRQYGDPVLKRRTLEVAEIDGKIAKLVDNMLDTMYEAPGSGLAANQVGVQRRIFRLRRGRWAEGGHQPRDR